MNIVSLQRIQFHGFSRFRDHIIHNHPHRSSLFLFFSSSLSDSKFSASPVFLRSEFHSLKLVFLYFPMEALLLPDQSISTYNRIGNRYKNVNNISSRSPGLGPGNSNPAYLLNNINGSLFRLPSSLSSTFSSFHSLQPPLLPLPLAKRPSLPSRNQGLSCPSTKHWKINKTKDQDLAPKKAKPTPKKDSARSAMKSFMIASTNRIGPDPSDLPKQAPKVLKSTSLKVQSVNRLDYSGLIFSLAPPPSSLPLPKFFLRPKTGCNAEAEGINAGATDDLRRLLRLP